MFSHVRETSISGVRRLTIAGIAGASLLIGLGACGGDDDDSSDTTAAAAETTAAPATTAAAAATTAAPAGGADVDAFCEAELAAEAAVERRRSRCRRAGVRGAARRVARRMSSQPWRRSSRPPAPRTPTAPSSPRTSTTMITYVKDNCGFGDLEVSTTEYEFGGVPPTLDAGPVVDHPHEQRRGVPRGGARPRERRHDRNLRGAPRPAGGGGETEDNRCRRRVRRPRQRPATPSTDLEPGHYTAICFLPVGRDPGELGGDRSRHDGGRPAALHGGHDHRVRRRVAAGAPERRG